MCGYSGVKVRKSSTHAGFERLQTSTVFVDVVRVIPSGSLLTFRRIHNYSALAGLLTRPIRSTTDWSVDGHDGTLENTMDIPAFLTLVEALAVLSARTARVWSRSDFFNHVINLALPLRSRTPSTAQPVLRAEDGFVSAQLPYLGRHLAALSTSQIKDLWRHRETRTRLVALEQGDPGYLDWNSIKGLRAARKRTACAPDSCTADAPDSGQPDEEIMGECDVSRFAEFIIVTDDTCLVPRETIEELLAYVGDGNAATVSPPMPTLTPTLTLHEVERSNVSNARPASATAANDTPHAHAHGAEASDADSSLAGLFDPVKPAALEKMFPAPGKWKGWVERAARNGLKEARQGRSCFNPYLAGMWFLQQGEPGWDLARCYRILANNLPARSRSEGHRLTGLLD